jgi:serine/threonine protein kinase
MHPNLGLIFGAELWHRTPVLVIELLEGGTLAERLTRGPLPVDEAVSLTLSLCGAVDALHSAGLLHGDIKPSNIGFTANGTPKLLDFGLARLLSTTTIPSAELADAAVSQSTIGGTPLYLPPEAFEHARPSSAFDRWALGVVLFEMIAGRHPFVDQGLAGLKRRLAGTPDTSALAAAPPPLVSAIEAALARDPARRPESASAFAAMLQAAMRRSV